ncbi:MAG: phosphoglycerate kinase [Firmicutes bacterium]|nr:phosphoglycerate kinase [Bacillota bacterium]
MNKKTIKDAEFCGKRVLLRCDFNVPVKDGRITDDNRIVEALPTIRYLLNGGARLVLCSHLGRPKGEFNKKYTLKPVAERLSELLGQEVVFCEDVIGEDALAKTAQLEDGEAALLENLRFHAEEEGNDKEFCRKLAAFCDIYVNDAFGTAHRAHASTAGVVQHGFVKTALAGFLMQKELEFLVAALEKPKRPFVAILGGAKVSDKIEVIKSLLAKADTLLIGGGMAFTFLAAAGCDIGGSLCEKDKIDLARNLMFDAKERGVSLLLPVDVRASEIFPDPIDAPTGSELFAANAIPSDMIGLDIGPQSELLFGGEIKKAATILWNGPMGVFENPSFASGTKTMANNIADSDALSVAGGGDSAAAVIKFGLRDRFTHVSTGGGASLELIEGKVLPGVECLNNAQ